MKELLKELGELFTKEISIAKKIYEKTEKMTVFIEEEEADNLILLTEERQQLIVESEQAKEEIGLILKKLSSIHNITKLKEIDKKKYPEVEGLLSASKNIQEIYREAFKIEKDNQKKVKKSLDKYKTMIIDIQQGKKAQQIYQGQPSNQTLFLNRTR